jgi:hypothetical protein
LWGAAIPVLSSSPVLLDKVQFAVVLWIEVTDVALFLDVLSQLGLLLSKVWLQEQDAPAAAVSLVWVALWIVAIAVECAWLCSLELPSLCAAGDLHAGLGWPQTALANDLPHALEMVRVLWVVAGKVKQWRDTLNCAIIELVLKPSIVYPRCASCARLECCARFCWHVACSESIVCVLHVTGSIVKHAEYNSAPSCLPLKDVQHVCNLLHEVVIVKPAVSILACLKK